MVKKSAGLVIKKGNKILLCHPTNARWKGTYSIPKGGLEHCETKVTAAIRETSEEVGIIIPDDFLVNKKEHCIEYRDKNGNLYKKVFYYIVEVDDVPDVLPKEQLQEEEVDHAQFFTKEEAKKKIFWRFLPILRHLDD
jgi:predicted NUDIX family NTP pyrophosphohydrolase